MSTSGRSILIVDDNAVNLKLARVVLSRAGFRVQTAADAREALERLADFRPELILMDIQMPGVNGLELTQRLKADAATQDIRIVALTAYAMKGDAERLVAAGCDGHIGKPIDTRGLAAAVAGFLDDDVFGGGEAG